jgi:leucyl aminopeptidase
MIRFDTRDGPIVSLRTDCLVIGLFDDAEFSGAAKAVNAASNGRLAKRVKEGDLSCRLADTQMLHDMPGLKSSRLLVVGLGKRNEFNRRAWRKAVTAATGQCLKTRAAEITLALDRPGATQLDDYYFGRAIAEITGHVMYRTNDLKTARKAPKPALSRVSLSINAAARNAVQRGLVQGQAIANGQTLLRDLGNLPGNICTPRYLATRAQALAKEHRSLKAKILNEAQIRRLKMGCLLSVSRGSEEPPRFIILEHRGGRRDAAPIVLVGKGVTFDTGGISLKDPGTMDEMKYDMCGAASVLAALQVAATLKLRINIVGLIPAVENMPSGRATKPGDIVTSAAGKTVEILNTDAEGRLILCDALHYARRYKPAAVIDIATLTGACVVALGHHITAVMANDDHLARELVDAGVRADDRGWHMPLAEEYTDQLRSNFADLANVGGREGGAITAAAFLSQFTLGLRWAHLDIAGTAWVSGAKKGGTGRPLPLLADFLIGRAGIGAA